MVFWLLHWASLRPKLANKPIETKQKDAQNVRGNVTVGEKDVSLIEETYQ